MAGPFRLIPAHAGKTSVNGRTACARTAHPRSRGENIVVSAPIIIRQGSSPLTRGKHRGLLAVLHAGKTRPIRASRPWSRAHPRSRGENVLEEIGGNVEKGSSPLTRGKRRRRDQLPARSGLIPAHAGKTHDGQSSGRPRRAHPRSRGENITGATTSAMISGSSPLTRGKHPVRANAGAARRFIPAHAGKTT